MSANSSDVNITTSYEKISPETATLYLSNSSGNRSVNSKAVKRYAEDMRNGDWLLTHQGIAFDQDGRLIDGQHRLLAIVQSGSTVEMPVSRGVPKDNTMDIDSGTARSVAAQIAIGYGRQINSKAIGVINLLSKMYRGEEKPSTAKILSIYNKNAEPLEMICKLTNARNLSTAPIFAAYLVAIKSGVSDGVIVDFHDCLLHLNGKSSPAANRLNSILHRDFGLTKDHYLRVRGFILAGISIKRHIEGVDKKMPHLASILTAADSVYKANPLL